MNKKQYGAAVQKLLRQKLKDKNHPFNIRMRNEAHYTASLIEGLSRLAFFYYLTLSRYEESISWIFIDDVFLGYYYMVLEAIHNKEPKKLKELGLKRVTRTFKPLKGKRNNVFHIAEDYKVYWKRIRAFTKYMSGRKNANLQTIVSNTFRLLQYRDELLKNNSGFAKTYDIEAVKTEAILNVLKKKGLIGQIQQIVKDEQHSIATGND